VFERVLVVQYWIVELSVHPHSVDDFEPSLGQTTQGIGVTLTFIAMVAVVDFGPGAPGQGLLGEQVHGMAKVLVTGPSLVAGPARRIGPSFAGAAGHRGGARQALQSLRLSAKTIPVVADFGQKARGKLRSGPPVRNQQVMVGMTPEKFLDALAVDAKLFFDRKRMLTSESANWLLALAVGALPQNSVA